MIPNRPLVRRTPAPQLLRYADAALNPRTQELVRGKRSEHLTYTETRLLALLMRNPERICGRRDLLDGVWGEGSGTSRSTLDTNIARLRRKLTGGAETQLLHTVHGTGYVLSLAPFPTGDYGGGAR